jgi:hypothetical protein
MHIFPTVHIPDLHLTFPGIQMKGKVGVFEVCLQENPTHPAK